MGVRNQTINFMPKKKNPKQTTFISDDLASLMAIASENARVYPNPQRLVNNSYRIFMSDLVRPDLTLDQNIAFHKFVASLFGFKHCPVDVRDDYQLL